MIAARLHKDEGNQHDGRRQRDEPPPVAAKKRDHGAQGWGQLNSLEGATTVEGRGEWYGLAEGILHTA